MDLWGKDESLSLKGVRFVWGKEGGSREISFWWNNESGFYGCISGYLGELFVFVWNKIFVFQGFSEDVLVFIKDILVVFRDNFWSSVIGSRGHPNEIKALQRRKKKEKVSR